MSGELKLAKRVGHVIVRIEIDNGGEVSVTQRAAHLWGGDGTHDPLAVALARALDAECGRDEAMSVLATVRGVLRAWDRSVEVTVKVAGVER